MDRRHRFAASPSAWLTQYAQNQTKHGSAIGRLRRGKGHSNMQCMYFHETCSAESHIASHLFAQSGGLRKASGRNKPRGGDQNYFMGGSSFCRTHKTGFPVWVFPVGFSATTKDRAYQVLLKDGSIRSTSVLWRPCHSSPVFPARPGSCPRVVELGLASIPIGLT